MSKEKLIKYYRIYSSKPKKDITKQEIKKRKEINLSIIDKDKQFDIIIIEGDSNIYVILYNAKKLTNNVKIENTVFTVNNPEAINLDEAIKLGNEKKLYIKEFMDTYYTTEGESIKQLNESIHQFIKEASIIANQLRDSVSVREQMDYSNSRIQLGVRIEKELREKIEQLKELILDTQLKIKIFVINKHIYNEFNILISILKKIYIIKKYISSIQETYIDPYAEYYDSSYSLLKQSIQYIEELLDYINYYFNIEEFKTKVLNYIKNEFETNPNKKIFLLYLINNQIIPRVIQLSNFIEKQLEKYKNEKNKEISESSNQTENNKKLISSISKNFELESKKLKHLIEYSTRKI